MDERIIERLGGLPYVRRVGRVVADESLLGREIAGYRIAGVIGQGGMGAVYLADDLRLERKIALKLLPQELSRDPGYRERFLRESRLAAALDHPNVVPVHDAGEADGLLYIAMRFVAGERSALAARARGPLEPQRALALAAQVAGALDAAHARGLVHRDVKPGNVLVDDAGHAYLTDFGIAVELDGSAAGAGPGTTAGTLAYIAPEQIDGGPVDGRADQYALACVVYECLCGEPPFADRGSGLSLLWAHMEEPPPALTDAAPGLPAGLDAVLARGLAKRPEARFPSCEALVAAARDALASGAAHVLPAALAGPAPPLVGRERELASLREAWLGVRAGAGALVLVSGPRGAGKTRLLAELARELRGSFSVRYASAVAGEDEVLRVLARPGPGLVVVEDIDAAVDTVPEALEAAAREPRVLVVATFRESAVLEARIRLGPLEPEAIRSIAELYAGEDARNLPLDSVLEASGGLPGSVHELVSEWARGAATRRLRASAGRVAEERSDLRDAEAAVAEDVQALQLVRERARIYFPELGDARAGPTVQGPRDVRRRRRRPVLRPRAAGSRARGAARRGAGALPRRRVRQRQVLAAAGRAAPGPRGRRDRGQRAVGAGCAAAGSEAR